MAIMFHGYHIVEFKDLQKTVHNLHEILNKSYVHKKQYEKDIEELKTEIKSLKDEIASLKMR